MKKPNALLLLFGLLGLSTVSCTEVTWIIECYDEGRIVYSGIDRCPTWAGKGHQKLHDGTVIKGECRCSNGRAR